MGRQAVLIKLEESDRRIGQIYVRPGAGWSAIDARGGGRGGLERLEARVEAPRVAGGGFSVDDYLTLACMGRQAVLIKLEDSDRMIGQIYVRSGDGWSAIDAKGEGRDALERLRQTAASVQLGG